MIRDLNLNHIQFFKFMRKVSHKSNERKDFLNYRIVPPPKDRRKGLTRRSKGVLGGAPKQGQAIRCEAPPKCAPNKERCAPIARITATGVKKEKWYLKH